MIYKLTFPFPSPYFIDKQNALLCHIIFISTLQNTSPIGMATLPPKTLNREASQFNRQELMHLAPSPLFQQRKYHSGVQKW